uniref:DUF3778 domain-containing protein n=1 Tax=Syphacia muris TaxID=451379 RepID=A0A0N5ANE1_9BILA
MLGVIDRRFCADSGAVSDGNVPVSLNTANIAGKKRLLKSSERQEDGNELLCSFNAMAIKCYLLLVAGTSARTFSTVLTVAEVGVFSGKILQLEFLDEEFYSVLRNTLRSSARFVIGIWVILINVHSLVGKMPDDILDFRQNQRRQSIMSIQCRNTLAWVLNIENQDESYFWLNQVVRSPDSDLSLELKPGMLSMGFDVTKTKIHRKASNAATKALATVLVNGKTEQTPLKPKQVMNDDENIAELTPEQSKRKQRKHSRRRSRKNSNHNSKKSRTASTEMNWRKGLTVSAHQLVANSSSRVNNVADERETHKRLPLNTRNGYVCSASDDLNWRQQPIPLNRIICYYPYLPPQTTSTRFKIPVGSQYITVVVAVATDLTITSNVFLANAVVLHQSLHRADRRENVKLKTNSFR